MITLEQRAFAFVRELTAALLHAVRTIFIAVPVAALAAGAVVEAGGMLAAHRFPAPLATDALALAFTLVTGYAVALTLAVVECARGVRAVAVTLEHVAEQREAQFKRLGTGILSFEKRIAGH